MDFWIPFFSLMFPLPCPSNFSKFYNIFAVEFLVGVEVSTFGEGFAAAGVRTRVGPFARVDSEVHLERRRPSEVFAAQRTCVGSFVRVNPLVVLQVSPGLKTLRAPRVPTCVRLLPCVRSNVSFQVPLLAERFVAVGEGTHIWSFASLWVNGEVT